MGDKLKSIGGLALGATVLIGLIAIPFILFFGIVSAARHIQTLMVVGSIAMFIDLVVFLPLSIFKRLRGFTGAAIFISSFIFGLIMCRKKGTQPFYQDKKTLTFYNSL